MTTPAALLIDARARGVDRFDAQRLLAHVLGRPRSWLVAHDDAPLAPPELQRWHALLARCLDGEPIAYLVGAEGFHGLVLEVDANVLVPRPDTEVLVEWALGWLHQCGRARPRVADLGTGSGAIALALKQAFPEADVVATDVSPAALDLARSNAARLGLELAFAAGQWWAPLDAQRFDLVVSNPPYIAADDPHLPALRHEPLLALSPGGDGLGALRDIVAGAPARLEPGGTLLLEHAHDQADAVRALLGAHGFVAIETRRDLGGRARCTGGRAEPA